MMTKEGWTKIVNSPTPGTCIIVIGRVHTDHSKKIHEVYFCKSSSHNHYVLYSIDDQNMVDQHC